MRQTEMFVTIRNIWECATKCSLTSLYHIFIKKQKIRSLTLSSVVGVLGLEPRTLRV